MDKRFSTGHSSRMILYPTIELRDQPAKGELAGHYIEQAQELKRLGFGQFYIIDRDAQYSDKPFNIGQVKAFIAACEGLSVWVGGGIKDMDVLAEVIDAGAERVVLGPMFWHQEGLFAKACAAHPGKILGLVDAHHGWVWNKPNSPIGRRRALEIVLQLEEEGAAGIVYLERDREGFYGGIDAEILGDLAFALAVPLYVTGGIHELSDLRALKAQANLGIEGAIIGRALLDSRIDPISALTILRSQD